MAPVVQEPEIQFAQRLASNEKPIRTKAIKKLRKYFSVRSQKPDGGFTVEELLKIWKGLFYCLWMQDKALLQEDLSAQISSLIHSLQNVDVQFLFLESFLKTINREWNGIDRLRMDKFYTLVRFIFRQTFEMMKRKGWEASLVQRFVELLLDQVLRSTSNCPPGVQFHILDIYMAELARVGAKELTAEQNLTFIDPFCKTAAKSKNHILVQAICGTIFQEIVDYAPFAIEDLMNEARGGGGIEEDDSSQGDDEDEESESNAVPQNAKKAKVKHVNGVSATEGEDELSDIEDDDSVLPKKDEDIGPVLQFDYKAIADRLFELASRSNTSTFNRKKLYKAVKTFRDLSEGVFPQDEYPEEVSTDEDDDEMFGSRRRMRKRWMNRTDEEDVDEGPEAKKLKGKKKEKDVPFKQKKSLVDGEGIVAGGKSDTVVKKKRKKKKKGVEARKHSVDGLEQDKSSTQMIPDVQEDSPVVMEVHLESSMAGKMIIPPVLEREEQGGATVTDQKGKRGKVVSRAEMSDALSQLNVTTTQWQMAEGGVAKMDSQSTASMQSQGRKKKRRRRRSSSTEEGKCPLDLEPSMALVGGEEHSQTTPATQNRGAEKGSPETGIPPSQGASEKKRRRKSKEKQLILELNASRTQQATEGVCIENTCAVESPVPQLKKKKAMKKLVAEVIAERSEHSNGYLEGTRTQTPKMTAIKVAFGPSSSKKTQKRKVDGSKSDFVKFQSRAVPIPLFFKMSKRSPGTPMSNKQMNRTPRSESKKVTFGLKNNQTTEFRKTDRSLLVSPDGSSRVAFDPQQKPRFGVLKSPAGAQANRNSNSTPQRRPRAADFF